MPKLLVIEDDESLRVTICQWLEMERYLVDSVSDGLDGLETLRSLSYDLVILDWQLPGMSGVEILRAFRAGGGQTPVIMLTGKHLISEKETGFGAGADDYLTKPFHPKELGMRVQALLRRPAQFTGDLLKAGAVTVEPVNHRVTVAGKEVTLQPMEFSLLVFLLRHPGQVFSTDALLQRLWQSEQDVSQDAIYTAVKRLRKKIDIAGQPSIVKTVHGIGYKLDDRG